MSSTPIIMVPRQSKDESKAALVLAHTAAKRLGARIIITHVSADSIASDLLQANLGLSDEDMTGCDLEVLQSDNIAETLLKRAEELRPRLMVLRAGVEAESEITQTIISRTCCAAVVIRYDMDLPRLAEGNWVKHILVPLDAAPASAEAVRRAARIARRESASLDLLHITGPGQEAPAEPGSLPVGIFVDNPHYDLRIWQNEFLSRFFQGVVPDTSGLTPEVHLAIGEVADEIISFAKTHSTDLIVTAWQGVLDDGHAAVVRRLLSKAPCQLLFLIIGNESAQTANKESSATAS